MPRDVSFWRNVAIIGVAHVVVLAGLLRWSATANKPLTTDIVWMEGGAPGGPVTAASNEANEAEPVAFAAEAEPSVTPMEDALTMRTPPPQIEPDEPTPKPVPTPAPTATPRVTPKPSPKTTPSPSAKKAKIVKATPKPSATAKKIVEAKKNPEKAEPAKTPDAIEPKSSSSPAVGDKVAGTAGSGGRASGPGGASQVGWYGNMLHDRFFSEWVQPTSVAMSGAKMSALVRVRIEKDGRVSDFNIVRSSGNVVVDESVGAVAKRVTQVDPLPAGLGNAGHYDVNINFELNPE